MPGKVKSRAPDVAAKLSPDPAVPNKRPARRRKPPKTLSPAIERAPAIIEKKAVHAAAAPSQCIVCKLEPHRSFRLSNGKTLLRCPRCLLGWWDWPAFDPGEFYDQSYFQSADVVKGYNDYRSLEAGIRRTSRSRLDTIARLRDTNWPGSRRPEFLLDVGCGHGYFLDEARAAGWRTHGLEVSDYAARQARKRGLAVQCGPIESIELSQPGNSPKADEPRAVAYGAATLQGESATARPADGGGALPAGVFDCITLWDVIEHLRDPASTLKTLAGGLRPGGMLALSTGDITSLCARLSGAHWHLFNLPEHLFFFSPRSLKSLIERTGCRVVSVRREVTWFSADYLAERLAKTVFRMNPAAACGWLKGITLPMTLFDIVSIYAVKR